MSLFACFGSQGLPPSAFICLWKHGLSRLEEVEPSTFTRLWEVYSAKIWGLELYEKE